MSIFLGMICFAVFIIGISLLFLSFFKRKTKKRAVITIATVRFMFGNIQMVCRNSSSMVILTIF